MNDAFAELKDGGTPRPDWQRYCKTLKSQTQGFAQVRQGGGGWGAEVEEGVQGKE